MTATWRVPPSSSLLCCLLLVAASGCLDAAPEASSDWDWPAGVYHFDVVGADGAALPNFSAILDSHPHPFRPGNSRTIDILYDQREIDPLVFGETGHTRIVIPSCSDIAWVMEIAPDGAVQSASNHRRDGLPLFFLVNGTSLEIPPDEALATLAGEEYHLQRDAIRVEVTQRVSEAGEHRETSSWSMAASPGELREIAWVNAKGLWVLQTQTDGIEEWPCGGGTRETPQFDLATKWGPSESVGRDPTLHDVLNDINSSLQLIGYHGATGPQTRLVAFTYLIESDSLLVDATQAVWTLDFGDVGDSAGWRITCSYRGSVPHCSEQAITYTTSTMRVPSQMPSSAVMIDFFEQRSVAICRMAADMNEVVPTLHALACDGSFEAKMGLGGHPAHIDLDFAPPAWH